MPCDSRPSYFTRASLLDFCGTAKSGCPTKIQRDISLVGNLGQRSKERRMSQSTEMKTADRKWLGRYDRPHRDLREFLERAESLGEVTRVKGANWDLELGALAEIVNHKKSQAPALLFEDIIGYPKGFRVLSGSGNSSKRMALMLGFA